MSDIFQYMVELVAVNLFYAKNMLKMKNWFYMLVLKDFWKKVILTTFGVAVSKTF